VGGRGWLERRCGIKRGGGGRAQRVVEGWVVWGGWKRWVGKPASKLYVVGGGRGLGGFLVGGGDGGGVPAQGGWGGFLDIYCFLLGVGGARKVGCGLR